MDCDPNFVYLYSYDWIRGLKLDLSYGHIYILPIYLHVLTMYVLCIFIKCVLSDNLRYSSHMHQLMNFDFMEYD